MHGEVATSRLKESDHDMYEHGFSREMTNILSNPPAVASHVSSVFRLSRCVVFVRVALILGGIPIGIWH
jgi:hypothetical protein